MKTIFSKNFLVALGILSLLSPSFLFANGGDQRIVEGGKYFINLSRAPFTPREGVKTAMLISIARGETGRPVKDDIILRIRIAKLGGAGGNREFLFEQKDIFVKGGIHEFSYTFANPGLHEIFFDFAFAADPKKIYEAPDFLLDVQKPEASEKDTALSIALIVATSAMISGMIGWLVGRKH